MTRKEQIKDLKARLGWEIVDGHVASPIAAMLIAGLRPAIGVSTGEIPVGKPSPKTGRIREEIDDFFLEKERSPSRFGL